MLFDGGLDVEGAGLGLCEDFFLVVFLQAYRLFLVPFDYIVVSIDGTRVSGRRLGLFTDLNASSRLRSRHSLFLILLRKWN